MPAAQPRKPNALVQLALDFYLVFLRTFWKVRVWDSDHNDLLQALLPFPLSEHPTTSTSTGQARPEVRLKARPAVTLQHPPPAAKSHCHRGKDFLAARGAEGPHPFFRLYLETRSLWMSIRISSADARGWGASLSPVLPGAPFTQPLHPPQSGSSRVGASHF